MTVVVICAVLPQAAAVEPPPVVFDGFGFDVDGTTVAAALADAGVGGVPAGAAASPSLDIAIQGQAMPDLPVTPLAAEVRSRIEGFDMAAGLRADPASLLTEGASWTGKIGVAAKRQRDPAWVETFEVRTQFETSMQGAQLGLQVGPRMEWRLGGGTTLFLDGTAEARAVRTLDAGAWALPGTSAADGLGMLGVSARTGLAR